MNNSGIPHMDGIRDKKSNRRIIHHNPCLDKDPLSEVNEKLPKQVKYLIRPTHSKQNSIQYITAVAAFGHKEYEGEFTRRVIIRQISFKFRMK